MTLPNPYFEKKRSEVDSRGRLLVISYRFPPDTTIGARRWEKLAHFVAARGWGLDVITRQPDPNERDYARMEALPPGVRVFGVEQPFLPVESLEHWLWKAYRALQQRRAREETESKSVRDGERVPTGKTRTLSLDRAEIRWPPTSWRAFLRMYWVLIEHAHFASWARDVTELGTRVVESGPHSAVISSGPPHMSHESGRQIAHRTGIPFVMDMRDLWSLSPRLHEHVASPLWFGIAQRYERRAVTAASLVVANNEPARLSLVATYPAVADRIITVLNGADDYPLPPTHHDACFRIRFAGTIYITSDVTNLLRAVRVVVKDLALHPGELSVELIGPMENPEHVTIMDIARGEHVDDFVSVGPARPHAAALDFLAGASMLVIFSGFGAVTLPAKTFEYMRFDAWILAQGEPGSALDLLLRDTGADVVAPDDVVATAAAIRRRVEQHRAGIQPSRIVRDDRFSRARQAAILLDALEELPRLR